MSPTSPAGKNSVSHSRWFLFFRIILGVVLTWKAINFMRDTHLVEIVTGQDNAGMFTEKEAMLALATCVLTLVCALFIAAGLFTRIASVVQLPIVAIAALFIHGGYINRNAFELTLTIILPFLLLFFVAKGSGVYSADEYFRRKAIRLSKVKN